MNKLMTAVLGLTLMAGSAGFAQTATDTTAPASADAKTATAAPKAHKVKKHTTKKTSPATLNTDPNTNSTNAPSK